MRFKEDKTYYEYLGHRCLYYKHCAPIMEDTKFDHYERKVELELGEIDMVDWDPQYSRTAGRIDKLSLKKLKKMMKDLKVSVLGKHDIEI